MTIAEKQEIIRQGLEKRFNGHVSARSAVTNENLIIYTLKLKYVNYRFSYPVFEDAIEHSLPDDLICELDNVFSTLIWNWIRRED